MGYRREAGTGADLNRDAVDQMSVQNDLNVVAQGRGLPEEVKQRRWAVNAQNERVDAALQPRFHEHLRVLEQAVDRLADAHQAIADGTDLDLAGDSRQAAVWTVAGRCIGHTRALLVLLKAGFAGETAVQMRAMHEATRLVAALADDEESNLLRRWLTDADNKWVRPKETRSAQQRIHGRFRSDLERARAEALAEGDAERTAMIEEALDRTPTPEEEALSRAASQIYDVLSKAAHLRRSGTRDSTSRALRRMATGPHPDPAIRASYVDYGGRLVEEVLLTVGETLSRFYAPGWYMEQIKPLIDDLHRARESSPIDMDAVSSLAGE